MLNDVHFPPVEPTSSRTHGAHAPHGAAHPSHNGSRASRNGHPFTGQATHSHGHSPKADRIRERLPTVERADVGEPIYGEPEDRGDSFNTSLSLVVVVIVALTVAGLAAAMVFA